MDKPKTRTVSFRVRESIIEEIEKEAKVNLTSTNVLINQILSQYVSWDKYEHRMRMFPIPEDDLHYILESLDESQTKQAVQITFDSLRDWALISKKKFDIHSCLEVMEEYCRMVDISIEDNVSNGMRSYVLRHNMGKEISHFIEALAEKIFWDLVKIKVSTQSTNSTVVIKLLSKFD